MTDEEIADIWVKGHTEIIKDEELGMEYIKEPAPKDAFLAGLYIGLPQWHDLEKDPADLPKDDKDMLMSGHLILLTKMKGTDYLYVTLGRYNFSTQEFCYQHIVGLIDVVAWQEIVLPKEKE